MLPKPLIQASGPWCQHWPQTRSVNNFVCFSFGRESRLKLAYSKFARDLLFFYSESSRRFHGHVSWRGTRHLYLIPTGYKWVPET
jgi:hypothetical protein